MKKRIIYLWITLLFIALSTLIIKNTNLENSILLSKSIQIILIMFLIRISIGCSLYIQNQYQKQKYSYRIILNLGLLLFMNINILRQFNLLIQNWNTLSIIDIYQNTLKSFSYFAMLTLPCIIILAIYSMITNFILIKKEGFHPKRALGIILGLFAIIGLFGSQAIYFMIKNIFLRTDKAFIKYSLDICINATLSYFYSIMIATLYCNTKAANHIPTYDKDFIIILGSKIKNDGTCTPLLKGRADKAIEFAKRQYKNTKKKIFFIPSGGKGKDEKISEAEAIKEYLLEQGIDNNQIITESKSTSTYENMKYSKEKINQIKENGNIVFSTTNYHVFRSGVIANNQGIDCEGIGSKTKWYFYSNALIREFIANLVEEKRIHVILLVLINLSLLILIGIGRYYNFIKIM